MFKFLSSMLILMILLVSIPSSNITLASKMTANEPEKTVGNTPSPSLSTIAPTATLGKINPSITPTASTKPTVTAAATPHNTPVLTPKPEVPAVTQKPAEEISRLVVIDAGHGGRDPGTSDYGLVEKDVTLDIAQKLESLLKKSGIKTYMIRNEDTYSDHRERIKLANSMNASMYISIHLDWFKDRTVSGATTYYINKNLTAGNLTEIQYAQNVHRELMKKININNRNTIERPDLAILKYAEMPSVLVELAFLSNSGNASLLATQDFRQKCAEGLAEGIRLSVDKIGSK